MEELIDLIATNSSPSEVTDKIKDLLFAKAAERVDDARPHVAATMFGEKGVEDGEEYSEDQE
jgi:hypothetical protein